MRFRTLRTALVASCMVVVAAFSALPIYAGSALAASTASLDYSNICPGDTQADFQGVLGANANATPLVTSPNGHCVRFSVNGGPRAGYAVATSGDLITLFGVGGWKTNRNVQIWLSDAFPKRNADHKFPLTNQVIGPDTDIHRECRSVIKGNQANPLVSYATPQSNGGDQVAFDPVTFQAPNVTETSIFNVRVSIPNPPCTALSSSAPEEQATDALLIVNPIVPTCNAQSGACLSVLPQVVYPGQAFQVSGNSLPKGQNQLNIGIAGSSICVPLGSLSGTSAANLSAPPFSNLPLATQSNGIYHFVIYASADATCASKAKANLYVAPPSLSAPTQLISGDSANITGTSWIGGAANSATTTPLQIVAFVGAQTNFNCARAKMLTLPSGTSSDGTFSFNYTAPDVNSATNDVVRVAAIPAGASTSGVCQAFDDSTCQSASPGASCPLIAATAPIQIIARAPQQIPWLFILIPLGLLLLLLPLFFALGRREEEELIVTEEDIVREVVDASASKRVGDSTNATYARSIRITRERVRIRDGKVLDEEVEEFDVYRDTQGREIRRQRTPGAATVATPPATPPTMRRGATQV